MLLLSPEHLDTLRAYAEATYPQECCGLLLGTVAPTVEESVRRVAQVVATANAWSEAVAQDLAAEFSSYRSDITIGSDRAAESPVSPSKADRFWIEPEDILQAQRLAVDLGLAIVGVYHSHPDHPAVPSERDRAIAWSDYSYLILAVEQGATTDVRSWSLDAHRQFQAERMGGSSPAYAPF
ncbi:metal-dependent protease of the PAD1/JAB1 superfamily [filamentous cyanobacterium CCP5]|nr:metal-dependent protease of the PAD1/JAB1 superfamily [filamentous cyanobacterium CCP5]